MHFPDRRLIVFVRIRDLLLNLNSVERGRTVKKKGGAKTVPSRRLKFMLEQIRWVVGGLRGLRPLREASGSGFPAASHQIFPLCDGPFMRQNRGYCPRLCAARRRRTGWPPRGSMPLQPTLSPSALSVKISQRVAAYARSDMILANQPSSAFDHLHTVPILDLLIESSAQRPPRSLSFTISTRTMAASI